MTDGLRPVNSIVLPCCFRHYGDMKHIAFIFGAGLTLAACGPLSLYYRPGVSVSRMQSDQTNCQVSALSKAPVANQIRQRPPIYMPGRQVCNASGCYTSPGYWVNGGVYTVDVNLDLRARVEDQCMAGKGYQPISVPLCSGAVKAAVTPAQTQTLPTLTERACAIRYDDGRWQIVNPVSSKATE